MAKLVGWVFAIAVGVGAWILLGEILGPRIGARIFLSGWVVCMVALLTGAWPEGEDE